MEPVEPMVRGYVIPLAARYVLEHPELSAAISSATCDELKAIAAAKHAVWVPRPEAVRIWSIVDQVSTDDETAYRNLVRGGETVAQQAISTFLKLLLRVLSPTMFARKFPDIWSHEHKGGYVEALLDGDKPPMVITIHDVESFPHVGPVAVGFIQTALTALGLKNLQVRDVTWTRAKPNPKDVRIEISWT